MFWKHLRARWLLAFSPALFAAGSALANEPLEIKIPQRMAIQDYVVPLLELALSKQSRPFNISFPEGTKNLTGSQVMEKLADPADTEFNLYAGGTSKAYEKIAIPIRVPLMRGLLGARIIAIPAGTQPKFAKVRTIRDLQNMTFLQGIGWGDVAILEGAGLTVETARKDRLYGLLSKYQGDAFPRGAVEILPEKEQHSDLTYDIEDEIVLVYDRFPFIFFTGKHDADLAKAITNGLEAAYADGSFIRFFRTHPMIQKAFSVLHLDDRRPIRVENPNLTPEMAAIPTHYWHYFPGIH